MGISFLSQKWSVLANVPCALEKEGPFAVLGSPSVNAREVNVGGDVVQILSMCVMISRRV